MSYRMKERRDEAMGHHEALFVTRQNTYKENSSSLGIEKRHHPSLVQIVIKTKSNRAHKVADVAAFPIEIT